MYKLSTSLGNKKVVTDPPDGSLRRCFQRETVKTYGFFIDSIKDLTPVWPTTNDLSFCGARSNLESSGTAEPHSLILNQATASAKPAYLHPRKSAGVSVCPYGCMCLYTCSYGDSKPCQKHLCCSLNSKCAELL
ncbi:hypothetical protein AMECASPLE_033513 [Ameca splendens]|uniref:Uncharacterized protein n=1 Tax=Ameca splendens TaxID=208324 RepID=A0ABV0Y7J6_9TELE